MNDFEEILSYLKPTDIVMIRSLLDGKGINYFIMSEHHGGPRLMVKRDQVQLVKEILKDLKLSSY